MPQTESKIYCECGELRSSKNDKSKIIVKPCKKCLALERQEGEEEGYNERKLFETI